MNLWKTETGWLLELLAKLLVLAVEVAVLVWVLLWLWDAATGSARAAGDPRCGDRRALVRNLESRFGERVAGGGMMAGGPIVAGRPLAVLLLMRPDGKSWTILTVDRAGRACVQMIGSSWLRARRKR